MYGPWQWGYTPNNYFAEKHKLIVRLRSSLPAPPRRRCLGHISKTDNLTAFQGDTVSDKVPYAFGSKCDWTGGLLANSANHIDYLGEHFYGYPDWYVDEATTQQFMPSNESLDDKVRRMSNRVEFKFEAWDEYMKRTVSQG